MKPRFLPIGKKIPRLTDILFLFQIDILFLSLTDILFLTGILFLFQIDTSCLSLIDRWVLCQSDMKLLILKCLSFLQ